jgi:hypothetical protein
VVVFGLNLRSEWVCIAQRVGFVGKNAGKRRGQESRQLPGNRDMDRSEGKWGKGKGPSWEEGCGDKDVGRGGSRTREKVGE